MHTISARLAASIAMAHADVSRVDATQADVDAWNDLVTEVIVEIETIYATDATAGRRNMQEWAGQWADAYAEFPINLQDLVVSAAISSSFIPGSPRSAAAQTRTQ